MSQIVNAGNGDSNNSNVGQEIANTTVQPGTAALWWLGQGSFVFEGSHTGPIVVDPYLSNSVGKDGGPQRLHPVPVEPGDLRVAAIFLTHDHIDHTDPDSLVPLTSANPDTPIYGPHESVAHLKRLGIEGERVKPFNRGETVTLPGVTVHAVYAEHTDDSIGLVFQFVDGPTVYHTGDTLFMPQLADVARFKPDFMDICINGRWGNMNIGEAVQVTQSICPRVVMPMHWGLFAENTADPEEFAHALRATGIPCEPLVLEPGVGRYTITRG